MEKDQKKLNYKNCGAKIVQIRTTENEKNRLTCVLRVLADGTNLAPIVIFKVTRWMGQKTICLDKIKEEEFDGNEKEIIDIDSDSADELDELEDDELNNDLY
ncbi:hypothetical protein RhiirA5_370579 [Rhizophagus irregularis]|uniref:Uncharacterized protein n=1 Tax=Rhizophagus irregularis TaxID=588596 RepID=A0A2N0Q901_9GLOM|nr:hypothetical protein RhiirA5_370579 [Rhizophagus irregularis]